MSRKSLLCPPPLCLVVIMPELFRPMARRKPRVKDFSGSVAVKYWRKLMPDICLLDLVVGLYDFNFFAFFKPDVGLLIAAGSYGPHLDRSYFIFFFDSSGNRNFIGIFLNIEDIHAFLGGKRGLLRNPWLSKNFIHV